MGSSPPDGCVGEICEQKPNREKACHAPPETAQQRSEREAKEKKEQDCNKRFHEAQDDAQAFMERYPRREDIEVERDRKLAAQQKDIDEARERRDSLRSKLANLETDAEYYGPKHPMPDEKHANLELQRKLLKEQEALVSQIEEEKPKIIEKYDQMVKRRTEILRHGVAPFSCDK